MADDATLRQAITRAADVLLSYLVGWRCADPVLSDIASEAEGAVLDLLEALSVAGSDVGSGAPLIQ